MSETLDSLDPAFVGRGAELAVLSSALDHAAAGHGEAVIVGGEAGIGKTRLLERFSAIAAARGSTVLSGACIEFSGRGLPYAPFAAALRSLVRSTDVGRLPALLGPNRRDLGVLVAELAGGGIAPEATAGQDTHGQARLFESVLNVLDHLGRTRPAVVVVEDLQWADRDTRDLLAYLIGDLRASRIVAIVSIRTGDGRADAPIARYLAEIEREPWVRRLDLQPFNRAELRALIHQHGADEGDETLDALVARSDGNPFYAEQLLALPSWRTEASISVALRDVLSARLAELSPRALDVVSAAACGASVDEDDLHAALAAVGRSGSIGAGLREAVDAGILSVEAEADGDQYHVRHSLLAEVASAQVLPGDRERFHRAFAEQLLERREAGEAVDPGALAFHFDRAHDDIRAVPALIEAGHRAEGAFAFAQAQRHFERALERWDQAGGSDAHGEVDRVWLLQHTADCAVATASFERAVELGREAVARLAAAGGREPADLLRLAELHQRLRWYLWESGDGEAAAVAVADGLREVPPIPPTTIRARLLADAAGLQLMAGDVRSAARLAEEAREVARAAHGRVEAALAGGVLGWCLAVMGSIDEGIGTFHEALRLADAVGGPEGKAVGRANLAALYDRLGRPEEALAAAVDGFEAVQTLGFSRTYGGELLSWAARALLDLGQWEEAAARIQRGLALSRAGRAAVALHVVGARLRTYQGDWFAAREHIDGARALDTGKGASSLALAADLLAVSAELAHATGDRAAVRAAADGAEHLYRADLPVDPALALAATVALRTEADAAEEARARHATGDLVEATSRADRIVGFVEDAAMRQPADVAMADPRNAAYADLCRAEAARAADRTTASDWERVIDRFERLGRPYPTAYARYRLAAVLLRTRGERVAAAAALISAHRSARAVGASPLVLDIEQLARYARVDLDERGSPDGKPAGQATIDPRHDLGLTERESEVLQLVAAGWSNQQIADALFITRKTASVHVSNILGKFGVRNRVEAAAIAQRLGYGRAAVEPNSRLEG